MQDYLGNDASFDVITINHTLEHSLAPLLLEQVRLIHKIGGVLFIAVPDANFPWAYDITSSTTHWSIFNEGFLRVLLQRYGYEVCGKEVFPRKLRRTVRFRHKKVVK